MAVVQDVAAGHLADDLMFGIPSNDAINMMAEGIQQLTNLAGDFGSSILNMGIQTFHDISSHKAITKVKQLLARNGDKFDIPNGVYYDILDIDRLKYANDVMRTAILSHPMFNKAFNKGYIDGYGVKDNYTEFGPSDVVNNVSYLLPYNGYLEPDEVDEMILYFDTNEYGYTEEIGEYVRRTLKTALEAYRQDIDPTEVY